MDTYNQEEVFEVKYLMHMYQSIGYQCIEISAVSGLNVSLLKALMQDQVTLFSGHSGVGKSTLVNAIEKWIGPQDSSDFTAAYAGPTHHHFCRDV